MTSTAMALVLLQPGWPTASIYRLRRLGSDPRRLMTAGLVANLAVAALAVGLCAIFREPIAEMLLPGVSAPAYYLAVAVVPFLLLGGLFSSFARALDRFDLHNWYGLLQIGGVLAALLVAVVGRGGALLEALSVYLGVNALVTGWIAWAVLRITGIGVTVDMNEITGSLRSGLKAYVLNVANTAHQSLAIFLVAYFLDAVEVANWAVALGVAARINLVPTSIATALFPRLAGASEAEATEFTAYVSRHSLMWVGLLIVTLLPTAPFLISLLFGTRYAAVVPAFSWMVLTMAPLTYTRVVARYFTALDRQGIVIAARVTAILSNIGLTVILLQSHGIVGAAIAGLMSYTIEAIWLAAVFLRNSEQTFCSAFLPRYSDLGTYRRRIDEVLRRARLMRLRS